MNKVIVAAITTCTIALACFKPETTPIATAAVTAAITQLANKDQERSKS